MNEKNKNKKAEDRKIVAFPNLGERLISKGMDELSNRNFRNAAKLFSQAREYDPDRDEVCMGLVVSLVELEHYEEARTLCKEMLNKGIGDYFQLINIYLMVLLQLNEHQEMVTTIELLFEENQIPFDKEEHFERMLQFSKRAIEEKKEESDREAEHLQEELQKEALFEGKSDNELFQAITKLASANIRPFVPQIKKFLEQEEGHPFFKTLLLNILIDQEYGEEITIQKFSKSKMVIPHHLEPIKETSFYKEMVRMLEDGIGQKNPSLFAMVSSLMDRHSFLMYPFEPEIETIPEWVAAYHSLAEEYMAGNDVSEEMAEQYGVDSEAVREKVLHIKELEKISYPII